MHWFTAQLTFTLVPFVLRCKYIKICYMLEIVFHKTRSSDDISIQKYKGFTKRMYL